MKRKLKIEPTEEPTRTYGKVTRGSKIRLKGKWLQSAGFAPGAFVDLTVISPGVIELRLCGVKREPDADYLIAADRLDHAIAKDKLRNTPKI